MTKSNKIDNSARTVSVCDTVEYKYDIETRGKVIAINGTILTIETDDEGFERTETYRTLEGARLTDRLRFSDCLIIVEHRR